MYNLLFVTFEENFTIFNFCYKDVPGGEILTLGKALVRALEQEAKVSRHDSPIFDTAVKGRFSTVCLNKRVSFEIACRIAAKAGFKQENVIQTK